MAASYTVYFGDAEGGKNSGEKEICTNPYESMNTDIILTTLAHE